jgi:S1/P1 Nuclease
MRRFLLFVSCCALLCSLRTAMAWNSTGHASVALIAYDQLSPEDKKILTDTLKHHPRAEKDLMGGADINDDRDQVLVTVAATWPDMIRPSMNRGISNPMSFTEHHAIWHYVDFPYDPSGKSHPEPVEKWDGKGDPENLLQAMQKVTGEVVDPKTSAARRAMDLCWIMHLTGDIHQPLHAVSLFNKDFPDGDKGGNSVTVWVGGQSAPLHSIWDDLEGFNTRLIDIRAVADRLEKAHPPSEFTEQLTKMDAKDWAMESFELAKTKVYLNGQIPGVSRDAVHDRSELVPLLSAQYMADAYAVADVRIALAGYRLAALLHDLTSKLAALPMTAEPATTPSTTAP